MSLKVRAVSDRSWHGRFIGPTIVIPLLITATTGVVYRWLRRVGGVDKQHISWLMDIHNGLVFGSTFSLIYVFWLGLGCLSLIYTGLKMLNISSLNSGWPKSTRSTHHRTAILIFLSLGATALSGLIYSFVIDFLLMDKKAVSWLMKIHQGSWVSGLEVLYTAWNALGVWFLGITGIKMYLKYR